METQPTTALAKAEPTALATTGELSVPEIVARVDKVKEVQRAVMKEGTHYGKIPGVDKPTLLKPGAEILGMVFRLDPEFEVDSELREGVHITYVIKCTLFHIPSGARLGSGMGSCSTHESKYAYRKGERVCPTCGKPAIIKGKEQYGGGWLCWQKKDGCGAKFEESDEAITSQVTGRIANEDVADCHNTVLKMAIKRAHVAAILFVTCASEIFTQDVEDQARDEGDAAQPARGKAPANGNTEVMSIVAAFAEVTTENEFRPVSARVKAIWDKSNKAARTILQTASRTAQQRILDNMAAPASAPANAGDAYEGGDEPKRASGDY